MRRVGLMILVALGIGGVSTMTLGVAFAEELEPVQKNESLRVLNIKPLIFNESAQGDPPERVPPDGSLYGPNAVFWVQGAPFRSVHIFVPQKPIFMRRVSLMPPRGPPIRIADFQSMPSHGSELHLNALGFAKFYVGAQRDALRRNQLPGVYIGVFDVTVVYQ